MFKFFDMIGSFLSTIVDFVVGFFNNVLILLEMIAKGTVAIFTVAAYLPLSLQVLAFAFISYCIIINVLNTGG